MTTAHRTSTGVALALALAVSAAPASARPFDLGASGSSVPADSARVQAPSQPTRLPPILAAPKPSQRAALRHAEQQQRLAYLADHQPNGSRYSSAEMNAYASAASATPTGVPSTVVHIVSHDGRFDWGDAGIGAAGGLGLALLGVGGAAAVSQQRRARRSKASVAITS